MRRRVISIVVLALGLLVVAGLRLSVGPAEGGARGVSFGLPADGIGWDLRGSRVVAACIVGAALAVAGVMLQSLLRNPLASPSVLGITSGAGLGVVISIYLGYRATGAISPAGASIGAALVGAFGALGVVLLLGQRRGLFDPVAIILIGVVVSVMCGAGVVFVQHLLPGNGWLVAMRWSMGSISDDVSWGRIGIVGGVMIAGVASGMAFGPWMDAASLGDDEARSVGVPLGVLRVVLLMFAGVLTAGTIVLAGPIGFVGLVCPHIVRLIAGPSHRTLVLGSALAGAALLVGADLLVRVADLGHGRMPVGVLTALLGGPTLIWLLRRRGPMT